MEVTITLTRSINFWHRGTAVGLSVATRFLDALVVNTATGETLFQALYSVLQTHTIPWINVIGFASNTVSAMVEKRNSVFS